MKKEQVKAEKQIVILENLLDRCTGCGVCKNACPHDAIELVEKENTFLYPSIDGTKCVGCLSCAKACPVNSYKRENDFPIIYAAKAKDEIRFNSSSGGMYPALASYVLRNGGVVYATVLDKDHKARFKKIESMDDLFIASDSKYVQSNTGFIFRDVKNELNAKKNKRTVLFVGCPCHVAGLRCFLGQDYDNLICVDIICHGVPSERMFEDFLNETVGNPDNISSIRFRDKNIEWRSDIISIKDKNDITTRYQLLSYDEYSLAFHSFLSVRNSCMDCQFAEAPRAGDISIGDFWGIREFMDVDNFGTSMVFINNKKGSHIFGLIKCDLALFSMLDIDLSRIKNRIHSKACLPGGLDPESSQVDRQLFFELYPQQNKFADAVNISMKKYIDYLKGIEKEKTLEWFRNNESRTIYTNVSQIGYGQWISVAEVVRRMPCNSTLTQVQGRYGEPLLDTPFPFGVLSIIKTTDYFVQILFSRMTLSGPTELYQGKWIDNRLAGWSKYITSDEFEEKIDRLEKEISKLKEKN